MYYKKIAVTGATGQQGGSIVRYLAKQYSNIAIQAITRSTESPKARELLTLSPCVTLVQADLCDKASMLSAFHGADAIFLVTDYWNTQTDATIPNLNTEIMNGITGIEAAAETEGLKHFVFGTLLDFAPISGMKWRNMYHFNTKTVLNSYIKAKPDLWSKTTLVYTPIFFENYLTFEQRFYAMLGGPKMVDSTSGPNFEAWYPENGSNNLLFVRIEDMGKVMGAIFEEPTKYYSKIALMVSEYLSADEVVGQWAEVLKVSARVQTLPFDEFKKRVTNLGATEFMALEIYEQMRCLDELSVSAIEKFDVEVVDMKQVVTLMSWREWVIKQDWRPFFQYFRG